MPTPFTSAAGAGWSLENTYAALPPLFHKPAQPGAVREPRLVIFNRPLAAALGLNAEILIQAESAALFAGNVLPEGSEPIAQAYAGHQFGHFTTLGDGRAILLGEQITPDGRRFDLQLKGPGLTAFSRGGDGRAGLGPMLREYIISEAMHALRIPTTRSLAVALTGETVLRQQPLEGAVLTRVAASHLRVGTFEWCAARGEKADLKTLADYTIARHFPDLAKAENPHLSLLEAVIARQATLITQWQLVGFIHGVMNTDNISIGGATIDYGPCAFMNEYDPATVFSSIDHHGRYAYANQPHIAQWNLARLAEALLPLLHGDETQALNLANEAIHRFAGQYETQLMEGMRRKLGVFNAEPGDAALIQDLLGWMHQQQADFTNTFRQLSLGLSASTMAPGNPAFASWHEAWSARRTRQVETLTESTSLMQSTNPAFIPRNHLVEEALSAAAGRHDFSVMEQLLAVLAAPYDYSQENPDYQNPPAPGSCDYQTFCGT